MVRRALPISAIPQPGEVLESWLGTLAARLDMTFGEFLFGVGSSMGGIDLRRPGLSVYLTAVEAAAVAASTGVETALRHAMTLARYDGHLVSIDASAQPTALVGVESRSITVLSCVLDGVGWSVAVVLAPSMGVRLRRT